MQSLSHLWWNKLFGETTFLQHGCFPGCLSSNSAGYIATWSSLLYVWIFSYPWDNGPRAVKNIANWYLSGKASWKFDFGVRQFPLTALLRNQTFSKLCVKYRKKTNIYAGCYLPFFIQIFSLLSYPIEVHLNSWFSTRAQWVFLLHCNTFRLILSNILHTFERLEQRVLK